MALDFLTAAYESQYFGQHGKHFIRLDEAEDYVRQIKAFGWKNARVEHQVVGPGAGIWAVRYGRFYEPSEHRPRRRMSEEADVVYSFAHLHDAINMQGTSNVCCQCGGEHCCCTCPRFGGSGKSPTAEVPNRERPLRVRRHERRSRRRA